MDRTRSTLRLRAKVDSKELYQKCLDKAGVKYSESSNRQGLHVVVNSEVAPAKKWGAVDLPIIRETVRYFDFPKP
jgi:hypothetical protein